MHCLSRYLVLIVVGIQAAVCAADETASARSDIETRRAQAVDRSLDWLLDYFDAERAFDLSKANEIAKHEVVLYQTAYLLTVHPELFSEDARRQQVLREVEAQLGRPFSGFFSTWKNGFAGFYLCELAARKGEAHPAFGVSAQAWIGGQNREGGWGHDGNRPLIAAYPTTLVSGSNFALAGLGGAREFGHEIAQTPDYQDVVEEVLAMYAELQSPQGGLPYGGPSYRKGPQSGRTAASLPGLVSLGQVETPLFTRGVTYVVKNLRTVPYGHGSPAMHMATGGLAFAMLGGEPWKRFEEIHLAPLLGHQQNDGSFVDFSPGPDSRLTIGASETAAAYLTASYAIALSADKSAWMKRLSAKFSLDEVLVAGRRSVAQATSSLDHVPVATPVAVWNHENVTHLGSNPSDSTTDAIAMVKDRQEVVMVRVPEGTVVASWRLTTPLELHDHVQLIGDRLLTIRFPKLPSTEEMTLRERITHQAALESEAVMAKVQCFDAMTGKSRWKQKVRPFLRVVWVSDRAFFIEPRGDSRFGLNLETGQRLPPVAFDGFITNSAISVSKTGNVFIAGQVEVQAYDRSDQVLWSARMRGKRGVTPVSGQESVLHAGQLVVTAVDGSVQCFDAADGTPCWRMMNQRIANVVACENLTDRVFLVGKNDGVVRAVSLSPDTKERVLWETSVFGGDEQRSGYETNTSGVVAQATGDALVIWNIPSNAGVVLDPLSGKPQYRLNDGQLPPTEPTKLVVMGKNMVLAERDRQQVVCVQ